MALRYRARLGFRRACARTKGRLLQPPALDALGRAVGALETRSWFSSGDHPARRLHLGRRRPRQIHADGFVLRIRAGRREGTRPLPRIHAGASCLPARSARASQKRPGRSDRGNGQADRRRNQAFVFRRIADHRYRRRGRSWGACSSICSPNASSIVATGNRPPDDFYKNGINRQLFLPFIDLFKQNLDIVELHAARDYRLERLLAAPVYYAPLGPAATQGDGR